MHRLARIISQTAVIALLSATPVLAQSAQAPSLDVLTPQEGQTIYGNKVPVLLAVENFELKEYATTNTNVAGQGHILLWLDDEKSTPDSAIRLATDTFTFSDVTYGQHTLKTELVNNNQTSLVPPVVKTVMFKTEAAATPSPVATSGFDKNTALVILVVVALVIVSAWWYTKDEDEKEDNTKQETANNKPKTVKKKAKKRNRK